MEKTYLEKTRNLQLYKIFKVTPVSFLGHSVEVKVKIRTLAIALLI